MSEVLISIAANHDSEKNLEEARQRLLQLLPDARFTEAIWTEPIHSPLPNLYLNQLAYGNTALDPTALTERLKAIETDMGRTDDDRNKGIVRIDLDLLSHDGQHFHQRDWGRPYVQRLLKALPEMKTITTIKTMHTREEQMKAFGRLLDVLDQLRQKCPWDKKQTPESLRPNTIEETFELCDAIMRGDQHDMMKELGDVLMHTCFYAMIAREEGQYDIADVLNTETDKLIFRHPHVYHPSQVGAADPKPLPYQGDQSNQNTQNTNEFSKAETSEQVLKNWEQIKLKEKDGNKTVLSGVPASLPSLIKAYRIQDKARNVGFDWQKKEDVWTKVHEELAELEAELAREDKDASEAELGDFLFSVINAARLYHLNPDNALERTNQKFIERFNYIEQHSIRAGRPLTEMTIEEMDELWNEAKRNETKQEK